MGDNADTTAAIYGQLAGAFYGIEGLPEHWLKKLAWRDKIASHAERLANQIPNCKKKERMSERYHG